MHAVLGIMPTTRDGFPVIASYRFRDGGVRVPSVVLVHTSKNGCSVSSRRQKYPDAVCVHVDQDDSTPWILIGL